MTLEELRNLPKSSVLIHKKYGGKYAVVKCDKILMKDSKKNWIECVIYRPLYENKFDMFVRPLNQFLEEFELKK